MDRTTFQTHLTLLSLSARHTGDSSPAAIDALLGLWWRKFGALPDGVLLPAFELALDTCKFFPSIAEFNDLIRAVAQSEGGIVDGATAWNACERALFACWSETRDRLILAKGEGYPWPDPRCKEVLRGAMDRTVRDVANMHPKEYAATRDRFVALYDQGAQVAQAQHGSPSIGPTPLRQIGQG
jgi:hypothetical protein